MRVHERRAAQVHWFQLVLKEPLRQPGGVLSRAAVGVLVPEDDLGDRKDGVTVHNLDRVG